MAEINQVTNAAKRVCWGRGDSAARGFVIQDSLGVAVDITGFSFTFTVNEEEDPAPGTELFTVTGVITNATAGQVAFSPTITDTNQTPGEYFYDLEQTDSGGGIDTLIKAVCEIVQDISK